ncbi:hypothetical protein CICLE_v10010092mg [Citrus x clementina]|uniref:Uncharacterized protein n=1 Tax=Citrus clementina TaxID=85681 RepID=V4WDA7_CITCL|nr:hypothetical protein CICLE_v10010092mg [Citrus x clementina]
MVLHCHTHNHTAALRTTPSCPHQQRPPTSALTIIIKTLDVCITASTYALTTNDHYLQATTTQPTNKKLYCTHKKL